MSYVLSFVGIKDGQGVTTTALAVASEIARGHPVLFVDADMSGTSTAVDQLHLDPAGRGMNNLVGEGPITPLMLQQQVVATRNQRLHLIPGLTAIYGNRVSHLIGRLARGGALRGLPYDFVVFDFGAAWAHALLEQPRPEAQAVAGVSMRVFLAFQDSPARIARSIQVLREAEPPKAELILIETRHGQMSRIVKDVLAKNLPGLSIATLVRWDPVRAVRAEDLGQPLAEVGEQVVRNLQIVERAQAYLTARVAPNQVGA